MFAKEFQTRLCGRTNILHDTVDAKRGRERERVKGRRRIGNFYKHLAFICATKNGAAEI